MASIKDIPKGKIADDLFSLLTKAILAESHVRLSAHQDSTRDMSKLCSDLSHKGTDIIRSSINEYGKHSKEHIIVFYIVQFCLQFIGLLLISEIFYTKYAERKISFRRINLPKEPIFLAFEKLNPGFTGNAIIDHVHIVQIVDTLWSRIARFSLRIYQEYHAVNKSNGYHYTSIQSLISMCSTNKLWYTEISKLNDAQEFQKTAEQYGAELKRNYEYIPKERFVKSLIETFESDQVSDLMKDVFVFSLTKESESSSQWLCYGQEGMGVCVGFDISLFLNPSFDNNIFDISYGFGFDGLAKVVIDFLMFEAIHASQIIMPSNAYGEVSPAVRSDMLTLWKIILSSRKNSSFLNEKEIRLCVISPDEGKIHQRQGRYGETRYIEQSFFADVGKPFLPICEVKFGNKVSEEKKEETINQLKNLGYGYVKFTNSETILR